MRKLVLFAALLVATLASAQTRPAAPTAQPTPTISSTPRNSQNVQYDEVTLLKRQVAQLQAQVKELKRQLDMVVADAAAARNNIPKCSATSESASASGRRRCDPYICDPVVGTCVTSCGSSADCAAGYVCDTGAGRCVVVPR